MSDINILTHIASQHTKAARVKTARLMTGCSRRVFFEKHKIPENTLRIWENPSSQRNGITNNGALRFIEALKKEGIVCSASWLLNGTGPAPVFSKTQINNIIENDFSWNEDESILKETEYFLSLHNNAECLIISDDALSPLFNIGDVACGIMRPVKSLLKFLDNALLVKTNNYGTLARVLKQKPRSKEFLLCASNMNTKSDFVIDDAKILAVAEISWIRKRQTISDI